MKKQYIQPKFSAILFDPAEIMACSPEASTPTLNGEAGQNNYFFADGASYRTSLWD